MLKSDERENQSVKLQSHPSHLQEVAVEQTVELEKSKEALEERLQFEYLISDLSTAFLNVPPDRVDDEVALVLDRVRRFFGADHCSLLEVLGDRKQIKIVNINVHE